MRSKKFITYSLIFFDLYQSSYKKISPVDCIVAGLSSLLVVFFCYWSTGIVACRGGVTLHKKTIAYKLSRNSIFTRFFSQCIFSDATMDGHWNEKKNTRGRAHRGHVLGWMIFKCLARN